MSGITDEGGRANSELVASWKLILHGLQPSSVKFYREEVSRFEGWLAAHDRPDKAPGDLLAVTRRDIEAWLSDLRTAGLSDATLRSRWVALLSLYRWLVEEDELEVSPLAKVMVAKGEALRSPSWRTTSCVCCSKRARGRTSTPGGTWP